MGFDQQAVRDALEASNNDKEAALMMILGD